MVAMFTPLHSRNCSKSTSAIKEKYDGAARPSYRLKLKYPFPLSVSCVQLISQQYESITVLKSTSVIKVTTMKNTDNSVTQRKPSCETTKLMLFAVSKDEWNTKVESGKSLKNVLDILQYAKRHLSGLSDVKQ